MGIIRDVVLPRGRETNRGFSNRSVVNAAVARKRTALEKRRANVQRWQDAARKRSWNAMKRFTTRCPCTNERAKAVSHVLNTHLIELEQQGMENWRVRKTTKEEKAVADATRRSTSIGNGQRRRRAIEKSGRARGLARNSASDGRSQRTEAKKGGVGHRERPGNDHGDGSVGEPGHVDR